MLEIAYEQARRPPYSMTPQVSVITATYNRPQVLAHAIGSVRSSTLEEWELLVIGDGCSDDTPAAVASFKDDRIHFVNLPENCGEQSGPNNEGVRRARGRYIAFLNHDDLYFPDHLAASVAFCEDTGADLVWSPVLVALPPKTDEDIAAGRRFRLSGVPVGEAYDPRVFVFASAWLLTRDLAERVGPWRPARETFVTSSQDWLFRAWRLGSRLRFRSRVTVLAVPGGARRGSYSIATSAEHDEVVAEMRANPGFREAALEIAAIAGERETNRHRFGRAWPVALRALLFRPASAAAIRVGVHPLAPYFALRHGRRGNLINAIRRRTGVRPLP
jgi:glycosyltransferase involved in cell wall biosynthesis